MPKYSDADVQQLVSTIRRQKMKCDFLTGAGMSVTADIPLARQLVEEIHKKYHHETAKLKEDQRNNYGMCMGALTIEERKELLSPYLDGAKINWAHIALASMLRNQHIRRVLTFNFDNVLARACGLLGMYPATYDFGISPAENVEFLSDPCIVHLHGQGYGPVMMNSQEETARHAKKLKPLLDESLHHSNLIVVGYSGEADEVFPLIKDSYQRYRRIFWLGYTEDPPPHLDSLIKSHEQVCIYIGGVDADEFMIKLAQELDCFPPEIFSSPAQHLLAEMSDVIDFPLAKTKTKFDILKDTRHRLESHKEALFLKAINSAALNGRTSEIANSSESDEVKDNESSPLIAWALYERAKDIHLSYADNDDLEPLRSSIELYRRSLDIDPKLHEAKFGLASAIQDIAIKKGDAQELEESISLYRDYIDIYPDDHTALDSIGYALMALWKITKEQSNLDKARIALERAQEINNSDVYNLACLEALFQNEEKTKTLLQHCLDNGGMPPVDHLVEDMDFEGIRNKPWFQEIIEKARLKASSHP